MNKSLTGVGAGAAKRFATPWAARALAVLVLAASAAGAAQAAVFAYVPNTSNGTASVIDTATQTQSTVLSGFGATYSAAVAPNGNIAYVVGYSNNRIYPIDTATNTVGAAIVVGTGPVNVTFSSNSATAYVSNYNANSISIVDVGSGTVTSTIAAVCPGGAPHPVQSVFNGTDLLFVCSGATSSINVMATGAGNALSTLATAGNNAYNIAISTTAGYGYVTNFSGGTVTKFDLTTGATSTFATTGVTSPLGLSVSPNGSKIYVADYSSSNLLVMTPAGAITQTLNMGGSMAGIGQSSSGGVLYVPLKGLAAGIKVLNTTTDTVTGTIANPGASPNAIWGDFLGNVAAPAAPAVGVPTLAEWAKISLAALLAVSALVMLRRRVR